MGGTAGGDTVADPAPLARFGGHRPFDAEVTLYAWARPVSWQVAELRYGFGDVALDAADLDRIVGAAVWAQSGTAHAGNAYEDQHAVPNPGAADEHVVDQFGSSPVAPLAPLPRGNAGGEVAQPLPIALVGRTELLRTKPPRAAESNMPSIDSAIGRSCSPVDA